MYRLHLEVFLSLSCIIIILCCVAKKASTQEDLTALEQDASEINEISKTLEETKSLMKERYLPVHDLEAYLSNIQKNQNDILHNQNKLLEYRDNTDGLNLKALKDKTKRRDLTSTLYCDNQLDLDACLEKHFDTQLNYLRYIEGLLRSVKLVDGSGPHEGRVEIEYFGRYGTVCDEGWDDNDARVVCRMLGYAGGTAIRGPCCSDVNYFGLGSGEILFCNVKCNGDEDSLFSCTHNGIGVATGCSHFNDAAVRCHLN